MIKTLIVDDDHEVAMALKRNIDGQNTICVVGIASNGQEAISKCKQLHPDVVLMDIRMPIMDGITASKLIKEQYSSIKIIMLTLFKDEDQVVHAVQDECDGYLFKGNKSEKRLFSCSTHFKIGVFEICWEYVPVSSVFLLLSEVRPTTSCERRRKSEAVD